MTKLTSAADDPYIRALESRGPLRRFRDRLSKFFFGDDLFISYARADAAEYAASLAVSLTKRRFICYLDQFGSQAEAEMPEPLKDKLMRSTSLVLVGTPMAAASANVRKEIMLFNRTRRVIIPVDVDKVLLSDTGWKDLVGLAKIHESGARVAAGEPSPRIVELIANSFKYRRRNQWQRVFLLAGSAFVALTVVAAVALSSVLITSAQAEADLIQTQARREAAEASAAASAAQQKEQAATLGQTLAEGKEADALELANKAITLRNAAVEQQAEAEAGMREAQRLEAEARRLEAEAKERAAVAALQEQGTRATVLARTPGKEFDGLTLAVEAARSSARDSRPAPPEVVGGLVASVTATDDGTPLLDVDGDVTYTQISPAAESVFAETFEMATGEVKWGVWDAETGRPKVRLAPPEVRYEIKASYLPVGTYITSSRRVSDASFSRDGERLAVIDKDARLWVWDLKNPASPLLCRAGVASAALDSKGVRVALRRHPPNDPAVVSIIEFDAGGGIKESKLDGLPQGQVNFSREDALLINSRPPSGRLEWSKNQISDPEGVVKGIYSSGPYDRLLGLSDSGRPFFRYHPAPGRESSERRFPHERQAVYIAAEGDNIGRVFSGYAGDISSAAVVKEQAYVVTVHGGQARVYGRRHYADFASLRASYNPITFTAISPNGEMAVTASQGSILVWSTPGGKLLHRLGGKKNVSKLEAAVFSDDGRRLVATTDQGLQVWDVLTGENLTDADAFKTCPPSVSFFGDVGLGFIAYKTTAFLQDRRHLVISYKGGLTVSDTRKCDARGFKLNVTGPEPDAGADIEALSPDGTLAVAITREKPPASMAPRDCSSDTAPAADREPPGDGGRRVWLLNLRDIKFGADGSTVDVNPSNSWRLPDGRVVSISLDDAGVVRVLLERKEGLASFAVWQSDVAKSHGLEGSSGDIVSAAWSLDGSTVAVLSRGASGGATVWSATTGRRLVSIPFVQEDLYKTFPIALSRDGSRLILGDSDAAVVRIFPTTPGRFLDIAGDVADKSRAQ